MAKLQFILPLISVIKNPVDKLASLTVDQQNASSLGAAIKESDVLNMYKDYKY